MFTTCAPRHCALELRVAVISAAAAGKDAVSTLFTTSEWTFSIQRYVGHGVSSGKVVTAERIRTINNCILDSEDREVVGALHGPRGECRNLDCSRHNGTSVLGGRVSWGFRWDHRRWCVAQFCALRVSQFLCLRGPESLSLDVAGVLPTLRAFHLSLFFAPLSELSGSLERERGRDMGHIDILDTVFGSVPYTIQAAPRYHSWRCLVVNLVTTRLLFAREG